MTYDNNCSVSRAVIDALADVREVVVVKPSGEAPCIDLMVIPLPWREKNCCDVSILPEVGVIVVFVALIALEVNLRTRSGVMTEMLAGTVIDPASDSGVDLFAGVDANMWAVRMTTSELIMSILASSEEIFLWNCEPSSCCPTATCHCRALQTRMPSFHV